MGAMGLCSVAETSILYSRGKCTARGGMWGFRGIPGETRGFRGIPGRAGARKNPTDDGDGEMSLIGRRKDGRLFMEFDNEDERDFEVPSGKNGASSGKTKQSAAQNGKKSKSQSFKSPRSSGRRDEDNELRLRRRSEMLSDEDSMDDEDEIEQNPSSRKRVGSSSRTVAKKDESFTRRRMSDQSTRRVYTEEASGRRKLDGESFSRRSRTSDEGTRRYTADEDEDDPRSDRRNRKNPPLQEQVYLPQSLRKNPRVGILGGGMSGLVCALTLEERGIRSTVFDTGKHGLGGRMGTRDTVQHHGKQMVFDHAAQYFTVKDPRFQKLVDQWIAEGEVREWKGVVGMLRDGDFTELPRAAKFVATNGMRHLADHMVSKSRLITVERPCWISSMMAEGGAWHLLENGLEQGEFDAVVIAHNGKCANRLLAPSGAPLVAKQMKRLELSSIWALLAAFNEPLPQPKGVTDGLIMDGAFVEGVNSLSWMANNGRKLALGSLVHPHCWTFFSTAAYGKKHKVPQESIPTVKAERVKREVLQGVEMALGIPEGTLPVPIYTRVQLWGAALPTNTPGVPFIFDPHSRVGICGDWLLGASLEAAAVSGMSLAHHIADYCDKAREGYFEENKESVNEFSAGLEAPLSSVDSHDIGEFPGTTTPQQQDIRGRALAVS